MVDGLYRDLNTIEKLKLKLTSEIFVIPKPRLSSNFFHNLQHPCVADDSYLATCQVDIKSFISLIPFPAGIVY